MSHRRQTPEEHWAKTHRRVFNRAEMSKRYAETQQKQAEKLGLLSRLFVRRR